MRASHAASGALGASAQRGDGPRAAGPPRAAPARGARSPPAPLLRTRRPRPPAGTLARAPGTPLATCATHITYATGKAASATNGAASAVPSWPSADGEHRQPHGRRHGRRGQHVGRQRDERGLAEVRRDQRRGPQRRRAGERRRLGQAARQAAPRPGRRGRARPAARMASTAAKLSCQPTSSTARGLSASVTAVASSSACQRRGGPARPARRRPPRRPSPPRAGSTARRRRAARRARWRPAPARAARAAPSPSTAATPSTRAASSITFCPDAATRCESPEAPELVARAVGQRRVVAEGHAAQQRGLGRRDAGAQDRLRPRAGRRRRAPASPPRRGAGVGQRVGPQLGVHAARALPGVRRRQRLEPAAHGEHRADALGAASARRGPARSSTRSPSSRAVATRTPNARARGASRSTTRACTACPMRGARRVASMASRRACATSAPATTAPASASRTAAREPSAGAANAASGTASGAPRAERAGPATSAAVPTCQGRARSSRERSHGSRTAHSWTLPLSAARRFGPMPGISPRSSIERKPPCCRRYSRILLRRGRADAVERVELLGRRAC